jgi:hypothetical protein
LTGRRVRTVAPAIRPSPDRAIHTWTSLFRMRRGAVNGFPDWLMHAARSFALPWDEPDAPAGRSPDGGRPRAHPNLTCHGPCLGPSAMVRRRYPIWSTRVLRLSTLIIALLMLALAIFPTAGANASARVTERHGPAAADIQRRGLAQQVLVIGDHDSSGGHESPYQCGSSCCDLMCHAMVVSSAPDLVVPRIATAAIAFRTDPQVRGSLRLRLERPPKTA